MKKIYILLVAICLSVSAYAQYNMYKNNGQTITTCRASIESSTFSSDPLSCAGGNGYCNSEDYQVTFYSGSPSVGIAILFVNYNFGGAIGARTFGSESGADYLYIYNNATGTGGPIATLTGVYTASMSFQSTSGYITLKWHSNGSNRNTGFRANIGCQPTDCNGNAPAGDNCTAPTQICNLNGYCGNTSGWYTIDNGSIGGGNPFCGSIENNSWISFVASSTSASLAVNSTNCIDNASGIQAAVMTGTCGGAFSLKSNCVSQSSTNGSFTLNATSLTVGATYYLMVDGFAGNICDYTVTANSGVLTISISATASTICAGQSTTLTANASGATGYSWSPGGATTKSITVSPASTTTYTCTISGSCGASAVATSTIVVNPLPVVTATPSSQTICSGTATGISLTSTIAGTTYAWTVAQTNVSGASSGSGSSIIQTLTATTAAAGTAVYTITPTAGGCAGAPINVTITVNPKPTVTATPSSQTICSGGTTGIALTSNVSGATFAWTVSQTNVSGASAGSGSSIAQVLTATTASAGTAVYTITPTANGCSGTPINVTITVNPTPVATATPSSQTICSGGTTGISLTSNVTGTTFAWTVAQTNVSGAVSGSGTSIAQTLSATSTVAGTAVYTITPTANGCSGAPISVTITVNPKPVVTATPSSQTICSGGTTGITLTSNVTGTTFAWTVAQTNVSGAASGSGSSIAQTLTATSTAAGTAVYTITPTANGCTGTAINVTITVNPLPVATATPSAQTICSGGTTGIALTSNLASTSFNWTVVQTNVSGASAGSGASIAQVLTATSASAGTAVYTITPTTAGCNGLPITVTITVNPKPVVTATPSSQTICSGGTTGISLASNVAGTTFSWTVAQTNVSGAAAGSGSSIAQTLTATATTAGTAVYTITPTANGCTGLPINVTITVNPLPVVTATPSSQTICSGGSTGIALTSNVASTTFSWTVTQSGVTGASAGSGSTISQVLTNSGTTAGSAVYTITPTANGCTGLPVSVTITVNPKPTATATPSAQTICSGGTTAISLTSNISGTTFAWTVTQTNVTGAAAGSGATIAQTLTATASTAGTAVYTITPTANGCAGLPISVTITVNPSPVAVATPSSQTFCTGGTTGISLSSATAGTTFTWTVAQTNVTGASSGSGSTIAQTLSTTTTSSGTAVYTITPTANGCPGSPINVTITVNPKDNASFSYSSSTYCQTGTNPSPTITGLAGGTFTSAPAGLSINSSTGLITLSSSTLGSYTVTYTTNGTCPNSSFVGITITSAPSASFSYSGSPFCQYGANPLPVFAAGASAGTFSASPAGLNFVNVNTGQINLTTSTPGSYTITNFIAASGGCASATATFPITISPAPVATATPASQTICSGGLTGIALTSSLGSTTFSWTVTQTNVSGASAGSGTSIAQALTATSTTAGTAVYTVTPVSGGCTGLPINVTITVNPKPTVTATPSSQTICSGTAPAISLSSNVAGTTFSWTAAQTNVSGASAGSGSSIAQTLTATTAATGTAVYTITPSANGCPGTPISVTIAVNPTPVVTATPSSQTICSGGTTGIALTSNVTGTSFLWTVTQTGVTGAISGSGNSIAQTLSNAGSVNGTAVYTITPTANGCPGAPITVTVTVSPIPVVTATPASQTICSGTASSIALTSNVAGTTFSWTASQTNVSGASAASGSSITQTLTASTAAAGTVVYTITPTANGCPGSPITVTITVNPIPTVTATPSSQALCSGSTTGISLTSNVSGASFAWTVTQTGVTGASAGSGSSITQALSTTGSAVGTAVYTITPTANGCAGTPITVTITVNPIPFAIATPSTQTICSGSTASIALSSFTAGTTFSWTVVQTGVAGAVNGSGSSISQALTATGSVAGNAVYTITPSANGCSGSPITATVTVNPQPAAVATPSLQTICSGTASNIALSSNVAGTTFAWTVVQTNVTGASASNGSSITQTLTASTTAAGTAVYTITPTANGCAGPPINVTITVNPLPSVIATPSAQTICSGTSTGIALTSNVSGASFSWTAVQTNVTGASAGSGTSIAQTLNASSNVAGTVVYTITASANGCSGTPVNVTITVNPLPTASASPSSQTICSGTATGIALSSNVTGTVFSWTVTQSGASGASAGSGSSIAQTLTAAGTVAGTVVYTITPSFSGCPGTPIVVNITVNPTPVITASPASQTFCDGGTTAISLSSNVTGTAISWTVAQTGVSGGNSGTGTSITNILNVTSTSPGTAVYTVVSSAAGCAGAPVSVTVNVNPIDNASFTYGSATFCQTGADPSATITGLPGGTFTSSPSGLVILNDTTGLIDVSASVIGTYTIRYQTNGVCPTNTSITLTITNAPSASFSFISSPFCASDPNPTPAFGSNASAGTFTSTVGLVFVNPNTGEINLAASTPGTYVITNTINPAGGCSVAKDSAVIVIDQAPTVDAGLNDTICELGTVTLNGSFGGSASSASWASSGSGSFSNTGLTPVYTPSSADVNAGSVILTITTDNPSGACAAVKDSIVLTITPLDSAAFSYSNTSFCQTGNDPSPIVTGVSGGTFTAIPSGLSINSSTGVIDLSASALGTYNVVYTTNALCPNTDTASVTITAAPSASFTYTGAAVSFCQTDANPTPVFASGAVAGIFTASPAGLVFVNGVPGQIDLLTSAVGSYTIYNNLAVTAGGCAATLDSVMITINQPAVVNAGNDTAICASAAYTTNGTVGGSALSGSWTSNGSGTFVNSSSLTTTYNPSAADTAAGSVTLYLTTDDPSGVCKAVVDSLVLTFIPLPQAPAVSNPLPYCAGSTVGAISFPSTGGVINWFSDAALTNNIGMGNPFTPAGITGTTTLWLTQTVGSCISQSSQVTITFNPLPVADSTTAVVTSAKCGDSSGSITNVTIVSGQSPYTYLWQDAFGNTVDTTLNLTNVSQGVYTLTITDGNGCSTQIGGGAAFTVNSTAGVVASFTADPTTGEKPLPVTFTNTTTGGVNYLWQFPNGDTASTVNAAFTFTQLGSQTVCLIANNGAGCIDTACTVIDVFINSVFVIPNVFTPNGDNTNDVFTVTNVGLKTLDAEIYNRWGEKEYEWHTTNGGWDGRTAAGVLVPDGTYFFIINATGFDGKTYFEKGAFNLIR